MRNLILLVLGMVVSLSVINAQTAEKDMKKSAKLLGIYHLDPTNNVDKLQEAKSLIDGAMASGEIDGDSKSWITKGEVYNALAAEESKSTVLGNGSITDVALVAFDAFDNAFDAAIKNWEKKEALKGMAETSGHLNTLGYTQYQRGEYQSAFQHFAAVISINDQLEANEMKGVLGDEAAKLDQIYITAVSAMSANDMDAAAKYFHILKDKNFEKAIVYDGLYKAYLDKDEAKAEAYLEEGRKKFPEEKSLLFTEINHYLKAGKLDDLIDKLEVAIGLEPNNASIYTTLGNVYDQLYQKALEGDDEARTQELFENSKANYDKALAIDPTDFAATYSVGALYYNKAAAVSQQVNLLADDYSKEGTAKYEAKKAEMNELFNLALPWFQKAESLQADDMNTMIALKEIHARLNDFEKSNEYKAKIEAMKN